MEQAEATKQAAAEQEQLHVDQQLLVPEPLLTAVAHAVAAVYLSLRAFWESCTNPGVVALVKRTSKTVLITAACHYVLLSLVLWPLRLVCGLLWLLSFTLISVDVSSLVHGSMAVYPILTLLLMRFVYASEMQQCFFDALSRLDPAYAKHLAAKPRRYRATTTQRLLKRFGLAGGDSEDLRTMLLLMVAGMLLRSWRSVPTIGWLVAPVLQYLSIRYMVGHAWAAAGFSLLAALHPQLERPVMNVVEVWASSKAVSASSLRYFTERVVPREQRSAFVKSFELVLVSYFFLPTCLLRLPLVGTLAAFPLASLGAFALEDLLQRQPRLRTAFDAL